MLKIALIIATITMAICAEAQSVKNLIFEGAGVRGIAYVGAIQVLEERSLLEGVEKVGGTSAGAIAALAVSLGYSSAEIETLIYNTKLQQFNDGKFLFAGGLSRIHKKYGWYRGNAVTKWLEEIIDRKTGDANITFSALHKRGFKDLYVTGTSLNNQKLIVFSKDTYPSMRVKDAVRISMSIPLYFEAVAIDSVGNVVDLQKRHHGSFDIVVDGGFIGNFPIFMFDSLSTVNYVTRRKANSETIGFRMDTPTQIQYDTARKGLAPLPVERFNDYMSALYTYVLENLNRNMLTEDDWTRTISISSGTISPKIRKMSEQEKDYLICNGRKATERYFIPDKE